MSAAAGGPDVAIARREELAANLAAVHDRVMAACDDAGRRRDEVTLVVVTKFFPLSDVQHLVDIGVRDIGESRAQEVLEKFDDGLPPGDGRATGAGGRALTTHFIGQVQTNKAATVVGWADVVHAVDRAKLVRALDRAADAAGRCPRVFLQVSLDTEDGDVATGDGRAGVRPAEADGLADLVAECPHLELAGVMAVAPKDADPDLAFGRLSEVSRGIQVRHPDATWVSAGMSGDLEAAIRHGATHLRVGTAILGSRPALR